MSKKRIAVGIDVPIRRTIDETYCVTIGWNLASTIVEFVLDSPLAKHRIALITDKAVERTFAWRVQEELSRRCVIFSTYAIAPGEKSKTRSTKEKIEDKMIDAGFGRDSCVLAIGGGVVTDVAGFVAGTFARGIPFINCPTTVLAASDASIGGKTGVDTKAATNLIGVFHQPRAVFIDLSAWRTLPISEVMNGLAETVKHACIFDYALFDYLETEFVYNRKTTAELISDDSFCERIAAKNCEIKRHFVIADERETNLRMVLNMGHTFGRAIEAASGYAIPHGQGVSIGIALQAQLGRQNGFVSDSDVSRVCKLLDAIGLPTRIPEQISDQALVQAMLKDKKVRGGIVHFVFQRGIGDFVQYADGGVSMPVDESQIVGFLQAIRNRSDADRFL